MLTLPNHRLPSSYIYRVKEGKLMSIMDCSTPEELSILANAVALSLSKGRTADELNILGEFISSVGDLISLMAAQKESLKNRQQEGN